MSIIEGLKVSLFGIGLVFVVLITLSAILKIQSYIFSLLKVEKNLQVNTQNKSLDEVEEIEKHKGSSQGELNLIGLDEKTAAMVMAIVSDESKIP
ncbi:MAG: OadG family protein, partial [Clostridiales bacterium]